MKKYEFTGETKICRGVKVHQIVRLEDGLIGGWIESELNLSHEGDSFVYDNAVVCNNAIVEGNAEVHDNAIISDNAVVFGNVKVFEYVSICGNSKLFGDAIISGNAIISGYSKISKRAKICGNSYVCGNVKVYGDALIHGTSRAKGNAEIYGCAEIYNEDIELGEIQIKHDKLEVYKSSTSRVVTAITKNGKTLFNVGCQKLITKEEFIDRIKNKGGGIEENPHREFYLKILNLY